MKESRFFILLVLTLGSCAFFTSCEEDEPCENIICQNGGICVDGTCDCPYGYAGPDCGTAQGIQALLDNGKTPKELYDENVPLDSLYGKTYEGGIIFYLNTTDGIGMVAAPEDLGASADSTVVNTRLWGCDGTDILNLNNVPWNNGIPEGEGAEIGDGATNTTLFLAECDDAWSPARYCDDLIMNDKDDWFLPSIKELGLMRTNLYQNGHGDFLDSFWYWSSTEIDAYEAWAQNFGTGNQGNMPKYNGGPVRAMRSF